MPIRVLLAGFEDPAASGRAAARVLDYAQGAAASGDPLEGVALQVARLPFSHDRASQAVTGLLRGDPPDYFLLVGTDVSSMDYKLHVLAANYADDPRPDAHGTVMKDTILAPQGPVAYRSRLPLDGLWDKFLVERVPVRMSHKAGLWVFNHVFYDVMRAVDVEGIPTRCGAMELPPLAGEEVEGVEPRGPDDLHEEFHMVLAVLSQLDPAGRDKRGKAVEEGARGPSG